MSRRPSKEKMKPPRRMSPPPKTAPTKTTSSPPRRRSSKPASEPRQLSREDIPPEQLADGNLVELRSSFGRSTAAKSQEADEKFETESQLWEIQGQNRRIAEDEVVERSNSFDGLDQLNTDHVGRGTSMDVVPTPTQNMASKGGGGSGEGFPPHAPENDAIATSRGLGNGNEKSGGGGGGLRAKLAPRKRQQAGAKTAPATGEQPPPLPPGLAPLRVAQAALVFVKPPASASAACVELVTSMLGEAGCEVVSEGTLQGADIDKRGLIDVHYGAIANRAVRLQPRELTVPAAGQAAFLEKFGVSWTIALEKEKVLNAASAAERLGVDALELERQWRSIPSEDFLKIGGGFYCGRMGGSKHHKRPSYESTTTADVSSAASEKGATAGEAAVEHDYEGDDVAFKGRAAVEDGDEGSGFFVVNGFYLGMRAAFVSPSAVVHWFSVRFPNTLPFRDFREKVIGATNPSSAVEGSIRRTLFEKWEELGLAAQPSTGANGVHASASPLEGLFERMNWLALSVADDPYGRELVDAGVPAHALVSWATDATVTFEGAPHSVFELHEGLDGPQCTRKAAAVYASDRKVKEQLARAREEGSRTLFGDARSTVEDE